MNRQQARAEERRIQNHLEKMAKLEATTNRLIELGVIKRKKKPLMMRVKEFLKGFKADGNNLRPE